MSAYIYITEQDRANMRKVNDLEVQELFTEALKHDPTLMILESKFRVKKGMFSKAKEITTFCIYHEVYSTNGKAAFQAKYQESASGLKDVAIAYLYGIINGSISIGII